MLRRALELTTEATARRRQTESPDLPWRDAVELAKDETGWVDPPTPPHRADIDGPLEEEQ